MQQLHACQLCCKLSHLVAFVFTRVPAYDSVYKISMAKSLPFLKQYKLHFLIPDPSKQTLFLNSRSISKAIFSFLEFCLAMLYDNILSLLKIHEVEGMHIC